MILLGNCSMRRLKRLLLALYLLHGPGRFLDRFPVSPSGPGQPLDRYPVSPSPCSRAAAGERPMAPSLRTPTSDRILVGETSDGYSQILIKLRMQLVGAAR
jgi:hypothetical protein